MEDRTRMGAYEPEGDDMTSPIIIPEIPDTPETKDPSDIWSGGVGDVSESKKHARKSTLMGDE